MPVAATRRNAAHLWRRAAFGATSEQIDQTVADGIEATVESMFDHRRSADAGKPLREPGIQPFETPHLNTWFIRLGVTSPTPAIERLMWFWHGHFAVNIDKFEGPEIFHGQLMTLRRHGLGRFDDLLKLMARDPAMIYWLDLDTSTVGRPNENYARELMELFSLGVDGGYNQFDVVEAGRAFTGHTVREDQGAPRSELNPALHDDSPKTILGQTGRFTGDDVVDLIVARPECHRHIATRMWTRYAGTVPPSKVLDELEAAFAARLVVKDLVIAMFLHPEFYSDEVQHGLVAQPVETVVSAIRGFAVDPFDVTTRSLDDDAEPDIDAFPRWVPIEMLDEMGQMLAHPPNVGGWPHNEPWLDATRSIGRLNAAIRFGQAIVEADTPIVQEIRAAANRSPAGAVGPILAALGHVEWSSQTEAAIVAALRSPHSDGAGPIQSAIAVAITSPEVTLS